MNVNLPQAVNMPNNYNTRHFGGYSCEGGRKVKQLGIIRSGYNGSFTQEDIRILKDEYRMQQIVDFRLPYELEALPPLDNILGVAYHHLSLFDENHLQPEQAETKAKAFSAVASKDVHPLIFAFYALGGTVESVANYFGASYLEIVENDHARGMLRKLFDLLLENEDGTIFYHCTGGKDRTGVTSALVLSALGVDWDTCLTDYLLTNEYMSEAIESQLAEVMQETDDPEVIAGIRLIVGADLIYMQKVQDYISTEFGTMNNYLAEALQLTEEQVVLLRAKYTE